MDVAQPADVAVDQVFALARSIEPARDFDFANRVHQIGDVVAVPVAVAVAVAIAVAVSPALRDGAAWRRWPGSADGAIATPLKRRRTSAAPGRLARVGAAEDDVFHLLAAQALRALFAHDPGQGIGDVALAAPVRADNRGHSAIEREFGAIGEGFETGDFETFKTHVRQVLPWSVSALGWGTAAQSSKPCPLWQDGTATQYFGGRA